ncbi:MAG: hypothetical protein HY778_18070 [Betaproteobacteria bacterium]|nr:hypothetical protein [Betaproteobacteria bacterium]
MTGQAILVAVEDELSAAVMRRLVVASGRGFVIDRVINARGNGLLKAGMGKFVSASRVLPHVVLTDLDRCPCPPELLRQWGASRLPPRLLLRIAVREVEAWLLADRTGMAAYLSVPVTKVPHDPETELDPKRTLINLARRSRKRRLIEELAPQVGSPNCIGPLYNARLTEFACNRWDVEAARERAPSLDRALQRLSSFLPP